MRRGTQAIDNIEKGTVIHTTPQYKKCDSKSTQRFRSDSGRRFASDHMPVIAWFAPNGSTSTSLHFATHA